MKKGGWSGGGGKVSACALRCVLSHSPSGVPTPCPWGVPGRLPGAPPNVFPLNYIKQVNIP